MIYYTKGNIFEAKAEALVNPVNCVGSMGAGLAKQFASRFPGMLPPYEEACDQNKLQPGGIWVYRAKGVDILNLATKDHWRHESKLEWIDRGIEALADLIETNSYQSVAVPALGCGFGRLKWEDVKYLIKLHLEELDANIFVFEPNQRKYSRRGGGGLRTNPTKVLAPLRGIDGIAVGE